MHWWNLSRTTFTLHQLNTFNTRKQKEGETIAEFVAELKRLSEHCKFGATLEEMPRDQLLCGVRDRRLQQKLLAESADLTWKKAFETAKALETAERNAKELQAAQVPKSATVHAVHSKPQERRSPSSPRTCYRCGGNNHHPSKCRFKDAECHYCKKRGHIVRVCRSKAQAAGRKQPRRTHQLTEESQPEAEPDDDTTYSLYRTSASENKATKPIMATMLINQAEVQMEVDTGASYSVISKKLIISCGDAGTSVELDLPDISIPGANPVDDDPPIEPMPRRSTPNALPSWPFHAWFTLRGEECSKLWNLNYICVYLILVW